MLIKSNVINLERSIIGYCWFDRVIESNSNEPLTSLARYEY